MQKFPMSCLLATLEKPTSGAPSLYFKLGSSQKWNWATVLHVSRIFSWSLKSSLKLSKYQVNPCVLNLYSLCLKQVIEPNSISYFSDNRSQKLWMRIYCKVLSKIKVQVTSQVDFQVCDNCCLFDYIKSRLKSINLGLKAEIKLHYVIFLLFLMCWKITGVFTLLTSVRVHTSGSSSIAIILFHCGCTFNTRLCKPQPKLHPVRCVWTVWLELQVNSAISEQDKKFSFFKLKKICNREELERFSSNSGPLDQDHSHFLFFFYKFRL